MAALFEPTKIKSLDLKNRLVRSATHEGMADEAGFPKPSLTALYKRLAEGGVGLIITGHAFVSAEGKSMLGGMLGLDQDRHVQAFRPVVEKVHANGARIAMQISHCGRQTLPESIGERPIAPSAVRDKALLVTPRAMTEADMERVIIAFGRAARRVRESGFDAVQLHAAHGYLLNQFLCPHTNRRKDRWGGSIKNRMRIITEVYRSCRREVGPDFPILIKINADDAMRKGLKPEESLIMARMMSELGFDGIEVSCGIGEDGLSMSRGDLPLDAFVDDWELYRRKNPLFRLLMRRLGRRLLKPLPLEPAYNLPLAKALKSRIRTPVFVVGGLYQPQVLHRIVEEEEADYVSLCRALIADPLWPKKIEAGRPEPSRCIHCNLCLAYLPGRPLRCYHGQRLEPR